MLLGDSVYAVLALAEGVTMVVPEGEPQSEAVGLLLLVGGAVPLGAPGDSVTPPLPVPHPLTLALALALPGAPAVPLALLRPLPVGLTEAGPVPLAVPVAATRE